MSDGAGKHPGDADVEQRERLGMPSGQPVRKERPRVDDPAGETDDPRGPGFESGQGGVASREEREKTKPRDSR